MRIAVVSESYPPNISGVAVFARNMAIGLKNRGHDVIVCSASPIGKPYIEYDEGIPVYRIRSIPNPVRKKFRLVVRQDRTLTKILKQFAPDIIHAQDPGGCSAAAQKFAKKNRLPIVATYHFSLPFVTAYLPFSRYIAGNFKPFIRAYCNDFYNECTVITCPTETVRQDLLTQKLMPPLVVISNGINTASDLAKIKREMPVEKDHPQLLFVGRIDEDKNLLVLLRAVPLILAQYPIRLTIVGDGNKLSYYKRWVRQHLLESVVHFTGAVPADSKALTKEYGDADVFVIPSRIETQSIVTMEAMLAGLPVVGARGGALPELIKHGETGLLVSPVTASAFAYAVTRLLEAPEQGHLFGDAGRKAVQIHSIEQTLDQFVALYKSLVR